MNTRRWFAPSWSIARRDLLLLALPWAAAVVVWGAPPEGDMGRVPMGVEREFVKRIDRPNPKDVARIKQRLEWQRRQRGAGLAAPASSPEPTSFKKSGKDKVLVILAEFDGTDRFTWTPGSSVWDPLGQCDSREFDGVNVGNQAASLFFARHHGITGPTNCTYSGPLHNQLPRPLGSNDPSAVSVWVSDFSPSYYRDIVFGSGIVFDYTRQDGSVVREDFRGRSVRDYYEDLSSGAYTIGGTVLGWVKVPHSVWWYGADSLPGARSGSLEAAESGAIPGAGDVPDFVVDVLVSARAAYPGFDWPSFDGDGDGEIDRLWIIHAGSGEEDQPALLNRTGYGEAGLWSHSSGLGTPYEVVPGLFANAYIMMPENAGIAVLAHEFAHNLGAMDLYTYGEGQTSAGFWTLMADSWVGFPLGFLPGGMDPMHLDHWGWLEPLIIGDPTQVHVAMLGQASRFPGGSDLVRAVKIALPDNRVPLAVRPRGQAQWWGGQELLAQGRMTLRQSVRIPSGGATLEFLTAYDTEADHDLFSVEVSANGGGSWQPIATWSGVSAGFPGYQSRSLSLAGYAAKDILLRFRYTTDESLLGSGPFVDDIAIRSGDATLFSHNAESDGDCWDYTSPWRRVNGDESYPHSFYLQWRNTRASGGYDQALGDLRFRFGPVDPGLLVWYQDDRYFDNRIGTHLTDPPSFGPKGRLLVVDAHPEPYADPYWMAQGITGERGNVFSRGLMRDAAFSRWPGSGFGLQPPFAFEAATFGGRAAAHWFSDARGYYPGIEERVPDLWRTLQWDASVVLPSVVQYPVRGPGYPLGGTLDRVIATRAFLGTTETLTYRTNLIAGGIRLPGGDGHPGAVDGHYGWNAWVVHQTDSFAQVVLWNSRFAALDNDADGFPNWQEAIAGTDPGNTQSFLRVTRVSLEASEGVRLEWTSTAHRVYGVWRSGDLGADSGVVIATNLPATPPVNAFVDPHRPATGPVFYRVEVQ